MFLLWYKTNEYIWKYYKFTYKVASKIEKKYTWKRKRFNVF